ncbi:MAG: hypothetical protein QM831_43780 [Kofleriaceae bacterium]
MKDFPELSLVELERINGGIEFPEPNYPGPYKPELGPPPDHIRIQPIPPGPGSPISLPGGGTATFGN